MTDEERKAWEAFVENVRKWNDGESKTDAAILAAAAEVERLQEVFEWVLNNPCYNEYAGAVKEYHAEIRRKMRGGSDAGKIQL